MLSTFSRSVPAKVYEAWIFLIRFLVSCIILHLTGWKLIPHFLAVGTQSINILLKFHCIFFILNFTIANTVISKKSYFRLNIWWDVIYIQREQQGTKNGALVDTRQNRTPVRFYSIYNNSLFSEAKKRIYPFQCLATNSIAKQFPFKEFMRGCIKCLFKVQYECVNLSSVVHDFSPIICYCSQLSFTTVSFPECMLPIWQEFIFNKMSYDIWTYHVFELQGTQVKETGR